MNIAETIMDLRQKRNLSPARLAKLCKISPSAISMIEAGKRCPSPQILIKLALSLNTTVSYLLGEESFKSAEEKSIIRDFMCLSEKQRDFISKQIEWLGNCNGQY